MKPITLRHLQQSAMLIAAVGTTFTATAGSGLYLGVEGGLNYQSDQSVYRNGQKLFDYGFKDGYIAGLTLGYSFANGLRPELEMDYRRNKFDDFHSNILNTGDMRGNENATTVMTNLWYDLKSPSGFFSVVHPYFGGGIGAARVGLHNPTLLGVEDRSSIETGFAYQGGAGLGVDLSQHLTLSADYRYLRTARGDFDTNTGPVKARYVSNSAMLGLRYSFGQAEEPVAVAAAEPPPPMPVAAPPPPPPRDSDGDGVIDPLDKCPNTPRGMRVDATGCIIEQTVILRGINFMFNSDELTMPARDTLNEVASALIGQPTLNIQIVGYTDSSGAPGYNLQLSQKRSQSVRRYLISKGVSADNLQARGAGEANPIASNKSEEGRAENRRVEFTVLNKPANVNVKAAMPSSQSKSAAEAGEPKHLKID